MSGFQDHFLDKYFAYRRRYVDHIVREAPRRARLAVFSECARLGFVALASALFAFLLGLLTVGAWLRPGGASPWFLVFGAFAALAFLAALAAVRGIVTARRDLPRVAREIGIVAKS